MGVNKVVLGDNTLIDISDSDVTPETLAEGSTAYNKSGEKITGTMISGVDNWYDLKYRPFWSKSTDLCKLNNGYLDLDWLPAKSHRGSNVISQQIEFNNPSKHGNGIRVRDLDNLDLSNIEKVCIIFDGLEYVCTISESPYTNSSTGTKGVYKRLIPEGCESSNNYISNSVFYVLIMVPEQGVPEAYVYSSSGKHTIEITDYVEGVAPKLPVEYLPDEVPHIDAEGNIHKLSSKCLDLDWIPKADKILTVIFEEQELELNTNRNHRFKEIPFELVDGETYVVNFNGESYNLKAHILVFIENGVSYYFTYLGNGSYFSSDLGLSIDFQDTGEPFLYFHFCDANGVGVMDELFSPTLFCEKSMFGISDSVIFSVTHVEYVNVKLPVEYLPDNVPYAIGGSIEILPETEAVYTEDDGFAITDAINGVEVGGTYTLTYNGVEYECTAQAYDIGLEDALILLGDASVVNGDGIYFESTGEPFAMMIVPPDYVPSLGAGANIIPIDGATSVKISIVGNNEVIHKVDPRCLPEGVPYIEGSFVEILPETPVTLDESDGMALLPSFPLLKADETYIINYNGVPYNCVCFDASTLGTPSGSFFIGNAAPLGLPDTGEPFLIVNETGVESESIILGDSVGTTITISISQGSEVIHKLDNKFLNLEWLPIKINKEVETPLAAEKTVTSETTVPTETKGGFPDLTQEGVSVGDKLVVYWDGARYPVEVVSYGGENLFAGNLSMILDTLPNTGEPFLLNFVGSRTNVTCNDTTGHVASIYSYKCEEEYNKIPAEFLPEGVGGSSVDLSNYVTRKELEELIGGIENGSY